VSRRALELPAPEPRDAADSARVAAAVRDACEAAGGAIPFDAYMELVLYAPGLGYYSAPRSRFGERGDFVTAPEISPRFAACLARQIAQVLDHLGGGSVLEVGAGSGVLAGDLLDALASLGHADLRYCILERSAAARAFQRERLAHHGARVAWLDDFPGAGFRGVILANELLDALPARRFQIDAGRARELGVGVDRERAGWRLMEAEVALPAAVAALLEEAPQGYRGELGPAREAWVRTAASRLGAGALLILDYGYPRRELYHPQRVDGTLACHYRHRVHADPFLWPGLADLSVHVDFTALAEAATQAGLELAGYTTQAHFLLHLGLLHGLDDPTLSAIERLQLTAPIHRLTLPAEMGEAVKAMALTRGVDLPLAGFAGRDLRHRL